MDDTKNYIKVKFILQQDEDGYPPSTVETVWAETTANGFVIANIPFFALGVSEGDIVEIEHANGENIFTGVVSYSGHSTVRIVVFDLSNVDDVCQHLIGLGCLIEKSHIPGLLAVDIPPEVDTDVLRQYLAEGEEAEFFSYEEAAVHWYSDDADE